MRPRLPLNTSRKPHKRFRLVPKSTTLDDLELTLNGYYAFLHYTCVFRSPPQFSSVQARDRPSGLRAFAEVHLEPSGRDVWLGTAGTLEAATITSLSDE